MADIFNREFEIGGAFSSDGVFLTFPATGSGSGLGDIGRGLLAQGFSYQYQQSIRPIFELGSNATYYVVGRTQGQASLSRLIGAKAGVASFTKRFGDACNVSENSMTIDVGSSQCDGDLATGARAGSDSLTLSGCLVQSVSGSINAQDFLFQEQVSMQFVSLSDSGDGIAPPPPPAP